MYKTALRATPRRIATARPLIGSSSRFISTAPPTKKSRSWKSSFARWGLAGLGVYWYNTSTIFGSQDGDEVLLGQSAEAAIESVNDSIHNVQGSKQPTLDAIVAEKRAREAQLAEANKTSDSQFDQVGAAEESEAEGEESLEGLEDEAGQQGAFNPETGEINWDCPCLGGMAHGPCGEEFKAAFSCFVYSTEEPKGVECIEKFKGMQDCFREHPEMYGSELADEEDELEDEIRVQQAERAQRDADLVQGLESRETDSPAESATLKVPEGSKQAPEQATNDANVAKGAPKQSPKVEKNSPQLSEEKIEELVPKAAHDASK